MKKDLFIHDYNRKGTQNIFFLNYGITAMLIQNLDVPSFFRKHFAYPFCH